MDGVKRDIEELRNISREGGGANVLEKWKSKGKGKLGVRERWVEHLARLLMAVSRLCSIMEARSWNSHL
jgi:hypothetical protein